MNIRTIQEHIMHKDVSTSMAHNFLLRTIREEEP